MSKIVIIVPCHNEALRLDVSAFRRFAESTDNITFLFVNDGSSDQTLSLFSRLSDQNPASIHVFDLPQNQGKAEAVRRGVMQAAAWKPDYIGFWDADLATPLDVIQPFATVLDRRPDLTAVIGVRLPLLGHDIHRQPVRRWLAAEFSQVVSLVFGQRIHDTQCGAKLFRRTPETLAAFSRPFSSRWIFDVELLARLKNLIAETATGGLRRCIYEYPLDQWEDVAGSNLKRGDFFKAIGELAAIWWRYLRPAAPRFTGATIVNSPHKSEPSVPSRRAA